MHLFSMCSFTFFKLPVTTRCTQSHLCCMCQFFKTRSIQFPSHLTLGVVRVSKLKLKRKKKLSHSDSRCCILMHRVSQGGKMRKSSPITRCPPAGQGQGLQQPDRWYCHPLFSITHTHTNEHTHRQ